MFHHRATFPGRLLVVGLLGLVFGPLVAIAPVSAQSPSTTIESPVSAQIVGGNLIISGSAAAASGVDYVELTLRNLDSGRYWNGSSWQKKWIRYRVPVAGSPTSASWSETVSSYDLTQGNYQARAWTRAVSGEGDPVGDAQVNFVWNDRPMPVEGLRVTATTESSVAVTWNNRPDDRRASFDLFVDDVWIGYLADPSATSYTFGGLDPGTGYKFGVTTMGRSDASYTNQAYAPRASVSAATEAPAPASPTTTIEFPTDGAAADGTLVIGGRATAPSGVAHIELMLRNTDSGLYWNGSDWQAGWIRYPVAVPGAPSDTAWSAAISTLDLTEGNYLARAWTRAVNGDGDPMGDAQVSFQWKDRLRAVVDLRVVGTTATTVTVAWNNDVDDRRVSFDFFVDDKWVGYSSDPQTTSHTFTGLAAGATHRFGITAVGDRSLTYTNQWYSPRSSVTADTAGGPVGETVVFRDDFDTLDTSVWTPEYSTYGDGNNEVQCYTPNNVSVSGGKLVLRALNETVTCRNGSVRDVTSGMVRSRGVTFAPGQAIEFRVKLTPADPANQGGLWPALWASGWAGGGWPMGGEMDWLEVMTAKDPRRAAFTVHYEKDTGGHGQKGSGVVLPEAFSAAWRTIRFEYGTDGVLRWYIDGQLGTTVDYAPTWQGWPAPFNQAVTELKLNLALGGNPGPLDPGALGDSGATFEIDYVQITEMN